MPRLRLPRPAAHTLSTLGLTRLPGSNLFSATKNNVFLHYLLSSPPVLLLQFHLSLILCISKHIPSHLISLWYHFPAASHYFFTFSPPVAMDPPTLLSVTFLTHRCQPLPAYPASHRRVCTVLCERSPGSCACALIHAGGCMN